MTPRDDDGPKTPGAHDIGCDLSMLSADELSVRIDVLKDEIARLETERQSKLAGPSAAESLFR